MQVCPQNPLLLVKSRMLLAKELRNADVQLGD